MRIFLWAAKKPLIHSQPPLHHSSLFFVFLLLLLVTFLLFLLVTFLLFLSPPPPPHRPIQPPNLSHCLPISISPPLNCCIPLNSNSPLQILNFTFPLSSFPLRTRPAAHLVDSRYISQYSKAVQLMKDLPNTDPRSFFQQANVHYAYCNGAYNQLSSVSLTSSFLFITPACFSLGIDSIYISMSVYLGSLLGTIPLLCLSGIGTRWMECECLPCMQIISPLTLLLLLLPPRFIIGIETLPTSRRYWSISISLKIGMEVKIDTSTKI